MFFRKSVANAAFIYKTQRILANVAVSRSRLLQKRQSTTTSCINFENAKFQKYLEALRQEFYDLRINKSGGEAYERMHRLSDIVHCLEQHQALQGNMATRDDIEKEKDDDMRKLIEEEVEVYTDLMRKMEAEITEKLLHLIDDDIYPSLIFEINAGVGGQEAMLFALELFEMYNNFFEHMQWNYEILTKELTDIGGLRHANLIVFNSDAYNLLRYEAGVHRVQRVPSTDKSGRIHTSTASVTVIPRPANININISEKDLKIETKRASGAGGQHVNTTDSAVRVVHLPTGLAVESQTDRSQLKNREIAIKRLKLKLEQQQLERDETSKKATRKAQQGNLNRNEKIRTYNFVQDRITDHRIPNGTVYNLEVFLEGGEELRRFMKTLVDENLKTKLAQLIENCTEKANEKPEAVHSRKPKQKQSS